MTGSLSDSVRVRQTSLADIDAIVQIDYQASLPPRDRSFFDDMLAGTDTETLTFLDAVFRCGANRWGSVDEFVVLEIEGAIAAGCAVYLPDAAMAHKGPIDLDLLPEISKQLGWNDAQAQTFAAAYASMLQIPAEFFMPQAEAIVESVAVFPEFRGRGLGHKLMQAAQARAKELGAQSVGIMAFEGNDPALRLYAKYFEPFVTYHAAYFGGELPGVTKFRAAL